MPASCGTGYAGLSMERLGTDAVCLGRGGDNQALFKRVEDYGTPWGTSKPGVK